MDPSELILTLSVLLQFTAAILALRLIKTTGTIAAWTLIAAAISFMGIRRTITLYKVIISPQTQPADLAAESVALLISILMVTGIALIGPVVRQISRVDEIRRLNQELAKERYLLNTLVENIPDPVFFKDRDSRFIRINQIMATGAGFDDPSQLIGKTDADIWAQEGFAEETLADEQNIMRTGEPIVNKEENIINRDGESRWVLVTKMPLRDESGEIAGTFGIARDITDRKQDEEALARANEELRRSNHDLEQFAYVASHDLQEPLRAVAGFTGLLANQYAGKLDETAEEYIGFAAEGARRMQAMINSLLEYARVGTRQKTMEETDFNVVCEEAVANLRTSIDECQAVVKASDLPTLIADRAQMVRVFQNLIGNALKFRSDEQPRIEILAKQSGAQWLFSVRDNGIGIKPKFKGRVFAIFQRLHSREKYEGTGIGLAICQRIIERHDGRIWVESELGEGSVFYFTIPMENTSASWVSSA